MSIFTQADLDGLKRAYASGILETSVGGRRMRFQSMKDMGDAITRMQVEIAQASTPLGRGPNRRSSVMVVR